MRVREGGRADCKHRSKLFACLFSPVCSPNRSPIVDRIVTGNRVMVAYFLRTETHHFEKMWRRFTFLESRTVNFAIYALASRSDFWSDPISNNIFFFFLNFGASESIRGPLGRGAGRARRELFDERTSNNRKRRSGSRSAAARDAGRAGT